MERSVAVGAVTGAHCASWARVTREADSTRVVLHQFQSSRAFSGLCSVLCLVYAVFTSRSTAVHRSQIKCRRCILREIIALMVRDLNA